VSEEDGMDEADNNESRDTLANRSPEYQALFLEYYRQCAGFGAAFVELDLPIDKLRRQVERGRQPWPDAALKRVLQRVASTLPDSTPTSANELD
jgi:hypothetical protein